MSAKPTLVQLILNAPAFAKSIMLAASASAHKTLLSLAKSDVGLGNVDNTSDANKPVSTAQQTALDLKVTGPSSATDNAIARFDATTGKLLQNSGASVDDSGNLSAASRLTFTVNETVTFPTTGQGVGLRYNLPTIWNAAALANFSSTGVLNVGGSSSGTCGYQLDGDAGIFHEGSNSIRCAGTDGGTPGFFLCVLNLAPITKAALLLLTPNATTGGRWRVTDATPANREAYPDGTNWRYTSDDTVVT